MSDFLIKTSIKTSIINGSYAGGRGNVVCQHPVCRDKHARREKKTVEEVQTMWELFVVNPATSVAGERSSSSARPLNPVWVTICYE